MKYHEKFPNALYQEEVIPGVFKIDKEFPCWNCGELTDFCDIDFDGPLCSEECRAIKYREFMEALRR